MKNPSNQNKIIYIFRNSILLGLVCLATSIQSQSLTSANHSNLLTPSAYGPNRGQLNVESTLLLLNGIEYGISDHFSAKLLIDIANPIFADQSPTMTFIPKWNGDLSSALHYSLGLIMTNAFDDGHIISPHATISYGSAEKNLTLGYGRPYYQLYNADDTYNGLTVAAVLPVGNNLSILTDNILLQADKSSTGNYFNFYSLGLRTQLNNKHTLDFGILYFTEDYDLGNNPWPYVKFSTNWNHLFKKKAVLKSQNNQQNRSNNIGKKRAQAVFVEAGGAAGLWSLNYDTRFSSNDYNNGLGARLGLGYYPGWTAIPFQFNYLIGKRDKYWEIGIGVTQVLKNDGRLYDGDFEGTYLTTSIKYRYQPSDGGLFFNVGFNPIFYIPWIGVGLGYSF